MGLGLLEPVVLEPVVLEPVVLEPVVLEPVVLEQALDLIVGFVYLSSNVPTVQQFAYS